MMEIIFCLSGLIVIVEGKCVQLKKMLKVCKYFHNETDMLLFYYDT